METPNDELVRLICAALEEAGLASSPEIKKIAGKMTTGKVRPEDWYALIENSLPQAKEGALNGS